MDHSPSPKCAHSEKGGRWMGQCLGGSIRGGQSSGAVDSVSTKQRSIYMQTRQLDRVTPPLRAPPPPESTASGDLRERKAASVLQDALD